MRASCSILALFAIIALCNNGLQILPVVSAVEAEWTPNDSDGGPLPLSQSQRDQLLQLDQAISQSPDPQATLVQVAEANGMSPEELADVLMKNRRDMQMAAAEARTAAAGHSLPRKILGLFWASLMMVVRSAQVHPRSFSVMALSLFALLYLTFTAPRTGIVMSTGPRPLLSSGHTTFLNPPLKYVETYLASDRYKKLQSSLPKKVKIGSISRRLGDDVLDMDEDSVTHEKLGRKSDLAFSITARKNILVESLLPERSIDGKRDKSKSSNKEKSVSDSEEEEEEDKEANDPRDMQEAIELAYASALSVLASRRFSEFVENPKSFRFQSAVLPSSPGTANRKAEVGTLGEKEGAVIVMKKLGDLRRYGIQPLRVAYEEDALGMNSVAFFTLRGGHFDGEIRFSVERKRIGGDEEEDDDQGDAEEDGVVVSVSLVVPKKGRKPNKRLAENMVTILANSIARSAVMEAKKTLARQSQSKVYRGRAKNIAAERRHIRFENEKKQEEMAADRKRKWQRTNPDAGRYRPSGRRMRSPNNC